MRVRFYIDATQDNETVRKLVYDLRRIGCNRTKRLGIHFHGDEEGIYCEYNHFLFGVPTAITAELGLIVRRVEIYERFDQLAENLESPFSILNGFYQHGDARAIVDESIEVVKTRKRIVSATHRKHLRVVAPTIEAAVELFNQIQQGKIGPTASWVDSSKTDSLGGSG